MTQKTKRWLIALSYISFIYLTLSLVRAPVNALRSMGLLRLSLGFVYVACFLMLFYVMLNRKPLQTYRLLGLFFIAALYWLIAKWVHTPEEQIHFFQYGLVGVFFSRALELHTKSTLKIFIGAFILASLAGWLDEILQGLLPNRHYDIRDIYLNAMSAFLGLLLFRLIPPKPDLNKIQEN